MRFVLASASPARLKTLRAAGLDPVVHVSGVDESAVVADDPRDLAATLARLKAEAVLAEVGTAQDAVVLGCDSILVVDGAVHGKPGSDEAARSRWASLRGRTGDLLTGHHLIVVRDGRASRATEVASTRVHFADVTDAEVDAYIATGEPQWVAGAFTLDGFGGAFVEGIDGDPHNVVGVSLPLLRRMLRDAGCAWTDFWRAAG